MPKPNFAETSIVVADVGPVASMFVRNYVIDAEIIHARRQKKHHLYVYIAAKKNKKSCRFDKYYYLAEKADAKAKSIRSEAREGIRLSQEELQTLDEILSPLLLQGQPLSHICNTHADEIKVSERSIYNYIEAGELTVCNLDLRRRVKYKRADIIDNHV